MAYLLGIAVLTALVAFGAPPSSSVLEGERTGNLVAYQFLYVMTLPLSIVFAPIVLLVVMALQEAHAPNAVMTIAAIPLLVAPAVLNVWLANALLTRRARRRRRPDVVSNDG
ncbi:MAG: hypothetical protein ABR498_04035 [Candidatus Dormibacteria bacterium]